MVLNVLSNYGMKLIQQGGAKAVKAPGVGGNFLMLFTAALIALLFRGLLVYLTYNSIAPKLAENVGGDPGKFRPLSVMEALLMVILIQNLFN